MRRTGAYEVVSSSPGLELGVHDLVAPEPDRQQPHEDDELYVVLDGRGTLEVEGERLELGPRSAAFVPAGAVHRFVGYEGLSVLLVFARPADEPADEPAGAAPLRIVPAGRSPCQARGHVRPRHVARSNAAPARAHPAHDGHRPVPSTKTRPPE